jgi:hypothetical protein
VLGFGEYAWASPSFCVENGAQLMMVRHSIAKIPQLYADMPNEVEFVSEYAAHIEQYAMNQAQCVATALIYPDTPSPLNLDTHVDGVNRANRMFIANLPEFAATRGEFWLRSVWQDLVNLVQYVDEEVDLELEANLANWAAECVLLALQLALKDDPACHANLRAGNERYREDAIAKLRQKDH